MRSGKGWILTPSLPVTQVYWIALHAPELRWVGPALPPGAQSLVQAVTQHFCYISTRRCRSYMSTACPWTQSLMANLTNIGFAVATEALLRSVDLCPGFTSSLLSLEVECWQQVWPCWKFFSWPSMATGIGRVLLGLKRKPRYSIPCYLLTPQDVKQAKVFPDKLLFKLCLHLMERWDAMGTFRIKLKKSLHQKPKSNKIQEGGEKVTMCISNILAGVEGNWNLPFSRFLGEGMIVRK